MLAVLAASVHGAEFYVSPTGSNSNPGTEAQPWATIGFATDQLAPGDTLFLRGGVYYETPTINVAVLTGEIPAIGERLGASVVC